MTTPNRPPSCDKIKPKLKECPFCQEPKCINIVDDTVCCFVCESSGPGNDPHGHKWNSIPRRSEVLELLNKLEFAMLTSDWNRQDELEDLQRCATKLRKEIGE